MDYFQPPPQSRQPQQQQQQQPPPPHSQSSVGGGGVPPNQYQQQQYNGLATQQGNSQSQSNSHMYYPQQMSSQGGAPQYYQQTANPPIEHGSQQRHTPIGYHSGNGAAMPPPPLPQQQQQQQQQAHMQTMQQHVSLQSKSHAGMMPTSPPQQQQHSQNRRSQMTSLIGAQGQGQFHQQNPMSQSNPSSMLHRPNQQHRDNRDHQMAPGSAQAPPQNVQCGSGPQIASQPQMQQRTMMELPVRLLIDVKHVGAIIGQGGSQIKELTKESKAKIFMDTSRKENQSRYHEKVVSVFGCPEACTKAVRGILDVIQKAEAAKDSKSCGNVELKLRAFNPLVGRLIGRQGATIKKIMIDTGTSVQVSNSENQTRVDAPTPPLTVYDALRCGERTISIRGPSVDVVSDAENMISSKLRACHLQDRAQNMQMNLNPNNAMVPPEMLRQRNPAVLPPMMINNLKMIRMWVPDNMVGPLIGTKGQNIKAIIRDTGAYVKIESPEEKANKPKDENQKEEEGLEESAGSGEKNEEGEVEPEAPEKIEEEGRTAEKKGDDERMVTIYGNDFEIFKGQAMIFTKISEHLSQPLEETKLRTEISVPSKLVGRIIGRGGQNVRELQRITGANVKIPEVEKKSTACEESEQGPSTSDDDLTMVRIIGNVQATHNVNFRLAHLVAEFLTVGDSNHNNNNGGPNNDHANHPHYNHRHNPSPRQ